MRAPVVSGAPAHVQALPPPSAFVVDRVDPLTDLTWADMARTSGHLFVSPPWLEVLAAAYGVKAEGYVVEREGRRGGLALATTTDLRGTRRCSLPFSDFADPLGDLPADDWNALLAGLAADSGALTVRYRDGSIDPAGFTTAWEGLCHEVDLTRCPDQVWDELACGARQNIRRAEREGVKIVVSDTLAAIERFHRLHQELRREKYGMLAQPAEFFGGMHDSFTPTGSLAVVLAVVNDEPVAAILLLRWADMAYYKLNASRLESQRYRANDLAMWAALGVAREWGCRALDLGVSDLDQPGLVRYKNKYATTERKAFRMACGPQLRSEHDREFDRLLGSLTQIATSEDVPLELGARVSSLLYRYFW